MSEQRTRDGDEAASEEWRKRRIVMHPDGPPPIVVNGTLARLRVLTAIAKDVSVGTVIITFLFGWLSGWIPFPLLDVMLLMLRKCAAITEHTTWLH